LRGEGLFWKEGDRWMADLFVFAQPNNLHIWGAPKSSSQPMVWENTLRVAGPSPGNPKGTLVLLPGQGGPSQFLKEVITRPVYKDAAATVVESDSAQLCGSTCPATSSTGTPIVTSSG
jgi:hypothetical protein